MKSDNPQQKTIIGNALLWKRIAAFLIDIFIIYIIITISFGSLFDKYIPEDYTFSEIMSLVQADKGFNDVLSAMGFASSILFFIYFVLLESKMQQSIGKKMMNLHVAGTEGNEVKLWQHIIRNIWIAPVFSIWLIWIDPLFMVFTNKNQRLSEILSRTMVVEKFKYSI